MGIPSSRSGRHLDVDTYPVLADKGAAAVAELPHDTVVLLEQLGLALAVLEALDGDLYGE